MKTTLQWLDAGVLKPETSDLPILTYRKGGDQADAYFALVPYFLDENWLWARLRFPEPKPATEPGDEALSYPTRAIREAMIAATNASSVEEARRLFNEAYLREIGA